MIVVSKVVGSSSHGAVGKAIQRSGSGGGFGGAFGLRSCGRRSGALNAVPGATGGGSDSSGRSGVGGRGAVCSTRGNFRGGGGGGGGWCKGLMTRPSGQEAAVAVSRSALAVKGRKKKIVGRTRTFFLPPLCDSTAAGLVY